MIPEERPAEPGELCTCGRQARTVITTSRWGLVGSCDIPGRSGAPVLPCPFCGATEPHREPWGDMAKCPLYRLQPADGAEDLGDALLSAVRSRVEHHGLSPTMVDVLVADWLVTRLAYDHPATARALLARAEQEGAPA
jgi:hypothetical protein